MTQGNGGYGNPYDRTNPYEEGCDGNKPERLTELDRGEVCVRTVAGGMTAQPFHGATIAEVGWSYRNREKVLAQSRQRWGRRREEVEAKLARWGTRPETPPAPKRTRTTRPSMVVNIENFYGGEAETLE